MSITQRSYIHIFFLVLKLKLYLAEQVVPFELDKSSEQAIDVFHGAADVAEKDKLLIQMNSPSSPVLVPK